MRLKNVEKKIVYVMGRNCATRRSDVGPQGIIRFEAYEVEIFEDVIREP